MPTHQTIFLMPEHPTTPTGLSADQVLAARKAHGDNHLVFRKENYLLKAIWQVLTEPMVIILMASSVVYFVTGHWGDGIFLLSAIALVSVISLFQGARSHNALAKLKAFTKPKTTVIRDSEEVQILTEDLVMGDYLVVSEGEAIPADGKIYQSNDFAVNESVLTGEAMAVSKEANSEDNLVHRGSTVTAGRAVIVVDAIGNQTKLGKIGKSLEDITEEKTPLELQLNTFVKRMVMVGAAVFAIAWGVNYAQSFDILLSLLGALTLAMSILPEEIPVAFTTFMALGAFRLMKHGIVVKQMKTVETLGSATVICTDKTGTLTENNMQLAQLYVAETDQVLDLSKVEQLDDASLRLVRFGMLASEIAPFDPMEQSLHQVYADKTNADQRPAYTMVHEYPLGGKPPMMTHIYEDKADKAAGWIVAAKGAPEAIMAAAKLSPDEQARIISQGETLAKQGYRLLGVACAQHKGPDFLAEQTDYDFKFVGLLAFYDPPKHNIRKVLEGFYKAGMSVKIITGDNAATTQEVAAQVGFRGYEKVISGDALMQLNDKDFAATVLETNIFNRMFPEAKLRIINALKAEGHIVAMTGDGVNDGPALKAAHIGIAMGKKGTEIAKQAASLILSTDDLSKMLLAVGMGRSIYINLKNAIRYIVSIHIPIILVVILPVALGLIYPNILSPIHVILLELIMGPTCSIIYENEPIDPTLMQKDPRVATASFFTTKELLVSLAQGLVIAVGIMLSYYWAVLHGLSESETRTVVFVNLVSANLFLTLINRSFQHSIFYTIRQPNKLMVWALSITILMLALMLFAPPVTAFFDFTRLPALTLGAAVLVGLVSVVWIELFKLGSKGPQKRKAKR